MKSFLFGIGSDFCLKKKIDINVNEIKTVDQLKKKIASEFKTQINQFSINKTPSNELNKLENNFLFEISFSTHATDITFQYLDHNPFSIGNAFKKNFKEIGQLLQDKYKNVYFSDGCVQKNLIFYAWDIEIPYNITQPFSNLPCGLIINVDLDDDAITLQYEDKCFICSESEKIPSVIKFIKKSFPFDVKINIFRSQTNRFLDSNDILQNGDSLNSIEIYQPVQNDQIGNGDSTRFFWINYNAKFSLLKQEISSFFNIPQKDIILYKNQEEIRDLDKRVVDVTQGYGIIFRSKQLMDSSSDYKSDNQGKKMDENQSESSETRGKKGRGKKRKKSKKKQEAKNEEEKNNPVFQKYVNKWQATPIEEMHPVGQIYYIPRPNFSNNPNNKKIQPKDDKPSKPLMSAKPPLASAKTSVNDEQQNKNYVDSKQSLTPALVKDEQQNKKILDSQQPPIPAKMPVKDDKLSKPPMSSRQPPASAKTSVKYDQQNKSSVDSKQSLTPAKTPAKEDKQVKPSVSSKQAPTVTKTQALEDQRNKISVDSKSSASDQATGQQKPSILNPKAASVVKPSVTPPKSKEEKHNEQQPSSRSQSGTKGPIARNPIPSFSFSQKVDGDKSTADKSKDPIKVFFKFESNDRKVFHSKYEPSTTIGQIMSEITNKYETRDIEIKYEENNRRFPIDPKVTLDEIRDKMKTEATGKTNALYIGQKSKVAANQGSIITNLKERAANIMQTQTREDEAIGQIEIKNSRNEKTRKLETKNESQSNKDEAIYKLEIPDESQNNRNKATFNLKNKPENTRKETVAPKKEDNDRDDEAVKPRRFNDTCRVVQKNKIVRTRYNIKNINSDGKEDDESKKRAEFNATKRPPPKENKYTFDYQGTTRELGLKSYSTLKSNEAAIKKAFNINGQLLIQFRTKIDEESNGEVIEDENTNMFEFKDIIVKVYSYKEAASNYKPGDVIYKYFYQTNRNREKVYSVEFPPEATVKTLKQVIAKENKIRDFNDVRILFAGKDLLDNIVLEQLDVGSSILPVYIRSQEDILLMTARALKVNPDDSYSYEYVDYYSD